MKSRISKILSGVLAVAMCASLAACAGGGSSSTAPTPSGSTASEGAASGAESTEPGEYVAKDYSGEDPLAVSITGVAWGNGAQPNDIVEQRFEEMMNLDLTVHWVVNTEYADKINMQMIGGTLDDAVQIMSVGGRTFYPQVVQAIENGVFHDLTPYVLDNGFKDANEIMKNWDDVVWENSMYEGKLYVVPRRAMPLDNQGAFWYRQDIFEKTDLEEPTTMDELADFIIDLQAAAKEQGYSNIYGVAGSSDDIDSTFKQVAVAYTGVQEWYIDDEGNFTHQSFMPEYKDFLTWVKKLYDAGAIDPEFTLNQSANSSFEEGNSVTRFGPWQNWNQSDTNKWFKSSVTDEAKVWAIGPIEGPKGPTITIGDGSGYSNPLAINSKFDANNIDRLLQAVCMTDEDYLWFLHYGEEGTHYHLVDGKPVADTEEEKAAKLNGYVGGWNQILLDSDPNYVAEKFERVSSSQEQIDAAVKIHEDSMELIEKYDLNNPLLTINSQAYNDKWTKITQDLINNRALVVMGQMSLEEWDAYVEEIVNSADYQEVVAELKEAYLAQQG